MILILYYSLEYHLDRDELQYYHHQSSTFFTTYHHQPSQVVEPRVPPGGSSSTAMLVKGSCYLLCFLLVHDGEMYSGDHAALEYIAVHSIVLQCTVYRPGTAKGCCAVLCCAVWVVLSSS